MYPVLTDFNLFLTTARINVLIAFITPLVFVCFTKKVNGKSKTFSLSIHTTSLHNKCTTFYNYSK